MEWTTVAASLCTIVGTNSAKPHPRFSMNRQMACGSVGSEFLAIKGLELVMNLTAKILQPESLNKINMYGLSNIASGPGYFAKCVTR